MKILQICSKVFWPERDGGAIAMYAFADGLLKGGAEVHSICLNIDKLYVNPSTIPSDISTAFHLRTFDVSLEFKPADALLAFLQFKNYHVSRYYSIEVENYIKELLSTTEFDVVVLEALFTAVYLPVIKNNSKAKIVLRAHNIEADIWQRLSNQASSALLKFKFRLMSYMLRNYERRIAKEVDSIFCLTDADTAYFKNNIQVENVYTIPLSIDLDNNISIPDFSSPIFYHLASMEWLPHQQAIEWFLEKVIPILEGDDIKPRIILAGRNMPQSFYNYSNEWLTVVGEIVNPKEWVSNKNILIVPSFTGSGVRVKIIEALARGHVVITTPNGTEGIPFINWKHLIVVDSAQEFSEAIRLCNSDPLLCAEIAKNAQKLAYQFFNRYAVGQECLNILRNISLEK
jgi:polysaccharide biosynthesis protein PslH